MLYTRYVRVDGCRGTIVYALYKVSQWMGADEPLFMLYTR